MPILNLGGECCLCPIPLGSQDCADLQTGIAEAYYTCPKNVISIGISAVIMAIRTIRVLFFLFILYIIW